MSFNAGAVILVKCDQNGRDLPQDNARSFDKDGKIKYSCGCPNHYFLVLSPKSFNDVLHTDFSKMTSSSDMDKLKQIKLCTAVPIDEALTLEPYIYSFDEMDYIESWNPESKNKIKEFKKRLNRVRCDIICKVNISQLVNQRTLFYVSEKAFEKIINCINHYLQLGKSDLSGVISSMNRK